MVYIFNPISKELIEIEESQAREIRNNFLKNNIILWLISIN